MSTAAQLMRTPGRADNRRTAVATGSAPVGCMFDGPAIDSVVALSQRGTIWSVSSVMARQSIGLTTTIVLCRYLMPEDYGLISMAAVLTTFLQSFADMGLSWATVQRKILTKAQVDNLFWINAAAGLTLCGVSALAGPTLATFFGRRDLVGLSAVLGISFVVAGFATQPMALLARRLEFRTIFVVEIVACLFGAVVAVGCAIRGRGYWSLVAQAIATQSMRLILAWLLGGYRPGLPTGRADTWGLVKFGGYLTAFALVTYVGRNLDNIVIGRSWGPAALGIYTRAYFLMSLPQMLAATALGGVMVPALAILADDRARLGRAYRDAAQTIVLLGLPLAAFIFIAAPELVRLIYGPRWAEVVPLLRWLSLAATVQILISSCGWLYVALGRGRDLFVVGSALTTIHSAAILGGNRWGPVGVSVAYAATSFLLALPTLWAAHRVAGIRLVETLRSVGSIVAATSVAAAVGFVAGVGAELLTVDPVSIVAIKFIGGACAFLACGRGLIENRMRATRAVQMPRASGGA
jgi:O-antigen/teichoic acid export membrane protein